MIIGIEEKERQEDGYEKGEEDNTEDGMSEFRKR